MTRFSYQSECHCAKTRMVYLRCTRSLVTSQNVTAPKLGDALKVCRVCLVTSQNVTAPKRFQLNLAELLCLVTSQNVTAPKHYHPMSTKLTF